jgi:hypothetical protein
VTRHYLGLRDAAVLATRHLLMTGHAVADLINSEAMGAVVGAAGLGKTFAIAHALESRTEPVLHLAFEARPTMRRAGGHARARGRTRCGTAPRRPAPEAAATPRSVARPSDRPLRLPQASDAIRCAGVAHSRRSTATATRCAPRRPSSHADRGRVKPPGTAQCQQPFDDGLPALDHLGSHVQ